VPPLGRPVRSPLESRCASVNIWPVLATPNDDAILGAPIVLPDHPQIAPRSHGNLFDNTEIEEALVLHVHSLTDSEREQAITRTRSVGRCSTRAGVTPQQIIGPDEIIRCTAGLRTRRRRPRRGARDRRRGYLRARRTLVLRPGTERDRLRPMLDGRRRRSSASTSTTTTACISP
jgi:hypothetical protein